MPSIICLSTIWEHTLTEILNHDNKTEVGIIMRSRKLQRNMSVACYRAVATPVAQLASRTVAQDQIERFNALLT